MRLAALLLLVAGATPLRAAADPDRTELQLARELHDPVSELASFGTELNLDAGPGRTQRATLNLLPIIPLAIGPRWQLVSRSTIPVLTAVHAPSSGGTDRGGFGDVTGTLYLAPRRPPGGWILGAGPTFRLPTASSPPLGYGVWAGGPAAAVLWQGERWAVSLLANHVRSFAGRGAAMDWTTLEPTLSWTTAGATTLGVCTESTYDWRAHRWAAPVEASLSQVVMISRKPVELAVAARRYQARLPDSPGWSVRVTFTQPFPDR